MINGVYLSKTGLKERGQISCTSYKQPQCSICVTLLIDETTGRGNTNRPLKVNV